MSDTSTSTVAPGVAASGATNQAGKAGEVQQAALEGKGAQQGQQQGQRDFDAEISKLMQESGFKMKFNGREQTVSFKDLVKKASTANGIDKSLQEAKALKAEADTVRQWKEAMDAEDPAAAEEAFEQLSPRAQLNALNWLQKKAAAFEQEKALPPEVAAERRKTLELQERVRQYEEGEKKRAMQERQQKGIAELKQTQQFVLGIAQKALTAIGANETVAPSLIPMVARHLRVAHEVAQASGQEISPDAINEEVINNIRQDLMEQYGMVSNAIQDDSTLYDFLGPTIVSRLARESIRRRQGGSKKPAPVNAPKPVERQSKGEEKPKNEDPRAANRRLFGRGLM